MHSSYSQRSLHEELPGTPEKCEAERSSEAALRRTRGQWTWNCADLSSSLSVGRAGGHVFIYRMGLFIGCATVVLNLAKVRAPHTSPAPTTRLALLLLVCAL